MFHRCQYCIVMPAYLSLKFYEYLDTAVLSPFDPSVQFLFGCSGIFTLENKAQFLFQQIGTVQTLVSFRYEFKLCFLFSREMPGAFPKANREPFKSLADASSLGASF